MKITILIPCLNEEETIAKVIRTAKNYIRRNNLINDAEILVSDNGSTDNSVAIAKKNKARVCESTEKGYGNALINGIKNAKGDYIIMGDADMSYDFDDLDGFIKYLDEGYDMVIGNRFKGGIEKGAMPFLHKLGVPFLSIVGNILFKTPAKDYHCGLRSFKKEKIELLKLKCPGMEFASEMICKASIHKLKIKEIPTKLRKDQRGKKSHLRTFRDGFRHLIYMINLKYKYKEDDNNV